jgi:type II secretory pathway pseudopilin PulG
MGQCSCGHPSRMVSLGFAYLWLLFAIAAIGLSLSLASEVYVISLQREKEKELLAIGRQFRQAIGHYYETKTQGDRSEYPQSLDDLLLDPRSLTPRRYLRKIFVDPITGKVGWGLFKVGGRVVGVYSLSEKVPIKQAGFEADDVVFAGKNKYSEWVFTYPADLAIRPTANNTPSTISVPAAPIPSPVIGEFAPPSLINSQ